MKKMEDNPLWQHCKEHHEEEIQDFETKVIRTHRTTFNRQVTESVLIQTDQCTYPMNRKNEYNGSRIPKILIEGNGKIIGEKGKTYPTTKDKQTDNKNIKVYHK